MSYHEKPMTASELFEIRQNLCQTPQSMAKLLGRNVNTYYCYERGGVINASLAMAVRYLATQAIPPVTQPKARTIKTFLARFAPGARFGYLVVEEEAPRVCGKRRFRVVCDCGAEKIMSAPALAQSIRCGARCTAGGTLPSASTSPSALATTPLPLPFDLDPSMPDLDDDDDITWLRYHHRKAEEAAATVEEGDELEAGL